MRPRGQLLEFIDGPLDGDTREVELDYRGWVHVPIENPPGNLIARYKLRDGKLHLLGYIEAPA